MQLFTVPQDTLKYKNMDVNTNKSTVLVIMIGVAFVAIGFFSWDAYNSLMSQSTARERDLTNRLNKARSDVHRLDKDASIKEEKITELNKSLRECREERDGFLRVKEILRLHVQQDEAKSKISDLEREVSVTETTLKFCNKEKDRATSWWSNAVKIVLGAVALWIITAICVGCCGADK